VPGVALVFVIIFWFIYDKAMLPFINFTSLFAYCTFSIQMGICGSLEGEEMIDILFPFLSGFDNHNSKLDWICKSPPKYEWFVTLLDPNPTLP